MTECKCQPDHDCTCPLKLFLQLSCYGEHYKVAFDRIGVIADYNGHKMTWHCPSCNQVHTERLFDETTRRLLEGGAFALVPDDISSLRGMKK